MYRLINHITKRIPIIRLFNQNSPSPSQNTYFSNKLNQRSYGCHVDKEECSILSSPDGVYCPQCKIAFVVGGTQGIGYATSVELLRGGAQHVILASRNKCHCHEASKALKSCFGHDRCSYIQMDVHNDALFTYAFEKILRQFKRLDIFVYAAGLMDGRNWEKEMSTNAVSSVRGTLLACQYMSKENEGEGGVILNFAGTMGVEALPGGATLAASKHAIVGLSKSLGCKQYEQKSGIRVVSLCPGFTKTRHTQNFVERAMCSSGYLLKDTFQSAKKQSTDCCGKAALHVIKHAKTGTVWVIDGGKLFLIKLPPKNCYYSLQAQYF